MQGRKEFVPKMLYSASLLEVVAEDDFYRKLDRVIDLNFLRAETASYYGTEGQESIDPVVFFKILLVGYLNDVKSDRSLVAFCADSFSVRLFLRYDIDEALPFHSTISRTCQLYGKEVFKSLFDKVLSLCVAEGMVGGKRQAIDSAFVKANASMDSLLQKEILADGKKYVDELNEQDESPAKTPESPEQGDKTEEQIDSDQVEKAKDSLAETNDVVKETGAERWKKAQQSNT